MALNNFNSFHNFNVAQQQRANGSANSSTGNAPGTQGERPNQSQQNAYRGQGRQTMRSRAQNRAQSPENRGQVRNTQRQRSGSAPNRAQAQMPQMQNAMPQQAQMPQMQNSMPFQPTAAPPPDQQVAQYMSGETSGIPINEENINQLIKTLNESDANKSPASNPIAPAGSKTSAFGSNNTVGRSQSSLAENALERLAQHIQNEANGTAFYLHLNRIAPTGSAKQNFEDISERCRQRANAYGRIYSEKSGKKFETKNVVINNQVSFKDGIQLALNEERKNISDLFSLYEEISDTKTEKSINCQIFRKLIDLHVLMDMKNHS